MSRECGACTLCCTAMAVPELDKPNGVPCEHLTDSGCGIYEDRPRSCRVFECAWLQGMIPRIHRPHWMGAVLSAEDGGPDVEIPALVVYTVPGDDRWQESRYLMDLINNACANGSGAFIMIGDQRRLITTKGSRLDQHFNAVKGG